jgi:acyl carrier protein
MKLQSESELLNLVMEWLRDHKQRNGSGQVEITADTNLMDSGVLDSLGFVELILFIETQSGCQIDLMDVDPAEFSVVKSLCGIAWRHDQKESFDASAH